MEKISVIVPVYKIKEQYLKECIESISKQTYSNLEIILVDDGSPDNCGEICDLYAEKDSRIMVCYQKNQGVSMARNNAIQKATGEWITLLMRMTGLKKICVNWPWKSVTEMIWLSGTCI